jgi:hypothetical protein
MGCFSALQMLTFSPPELQIRENRLQILIFQHGCIEDAAELGVSNTKYYFKPMKDDDA